MRTGDFSSDPFGVPLPTGTQFSSTRTASLAPADRHPFNATALEPRSPVAPDGNPGRRVRLAIRFPPALIELDHPADDQLYPAPTRASLPHPGLISRMCQCENSTKVNSTSAWITIFPARTRFLPASATIRQPTSYRAARRDSPSPVAFASTQNITNHGRNVVVVGNPHLFRSYR